ncbi:MAG: LruC domain-containing protein [Flavobacteriaceae bacterium]|nr:LruC domain-containing protein [Flavobacteriaceae bacterium]
MKALKLTGGFIALLLAMSSCKRDSFKNQDSPSDVPGNNITVKAKDLVVPTDFKFETEKDLTVRVKVSNANANERYVIKIYSDLPSTGALISTGATDASAEYTTKVRVPAFADFIYIEKINPDGSSVFEKVKANQFISTLFTGGAQPNPHLFRKTSSGMNCSSGCTHTYNNRSSNITVNNGQVVCLTGTFGGNIDIKVKSGGIVKICASGNFDELKIEGSGKAYILENTTLKAKKIKVYHKNAKLYNWSDSLRVTDETKIKGYFENRGKLYSDKHIKIEKDGFVKNYGTLKTIGTSDKDILVEGKLYNYHFIFVGNDLKIDEDGKVYNYCLIDVDDDLENEGYLWSNCYIRVGDNFDQKDDGDTRLDNGAFLSVKDFYLKKKIKGTGAKTSIIKVTGTTNLYSGSRVEGKIKFCDANGIESGSSRIYSPAVASCTGYLAASTCQPEQYGTPPIADCDNDGILDNVDEYPCDPKRAFNSYYPSANKTATLAFEDLWPAQGDYDFNDLTLAFNIHKVLDANNKVVDYNVKMKVRSVGASFDNGFGWQFDDLVPSDVKSVNGQILVRSLITRSANNTEASQSKAVIIAYDSPEPSMQRAAGSMFNTISANGIGTSDTIRISIEFQNPVLDSKLSIDKFNPFIFTNRRRGYEVHLKDFVPTSLATTSLFGTDSDRSVPSSGKYYANANGMPWAILIPVDFAYPTERTDITEAYNFFDDWATSGGATNTNWYTDAPGNRNAAKLFGLD